ncbi:AmmeMemoRadiSam system radical SAM enzyme [Ketobacter nezhaii]|uniref:AmmeMemoRadiSam system radical SAM enzyme n=1 Tax=Ketobacter sp. MCCC 1A13808 TaxID=2602738 RepID=UPI00294FF231|nr:AmmeMemoRadiSam system radical SAM enzyme [Ketobacter sp. MCCC 1A13808]
MVESDCSESMHESNPELDIHNPFVRQTKYWHSLEDGRVQCDICPRQCKLRDQQRGLCFVRANVGNQIVLTTYGRSSGFCVDPIEKKPLNHFYPGSSVLSFGTAGCNLSCKFCQNWDISKSRQMDTLASRAQPEAIVQAALDTGCRSVAFTYNDPVVFQEYAVDVAQACRAAGLESVAVSAGYHSAQARSEFYQSISAANIDLKAFSERFYWNVTGAHLSPVLDTLSYLKHETAVWFEITTLLIPGQNDEPGEIEAMSRWIMDNLGADVPLHFSAFHPDYKMKDIPATPRATLNRARKIAMEQGLNYVYTGNVHDQAGDCTYCPNCHSELIQRDWYQLNSWSLAPGGRCSHCDTLIPGRFGLQPDHGTRKAMPVRISR